VAMRPKTNRERAVQFRPRRSDDMPKYDDIKSRIAEIASQRDRTGKKPLETEERIQLLNEIYDGLLYFWKQSVVAGSAKGTSSISYQLERARLEIVDLARASDLIDTANSRWTLEFSRPPEEVSAKPEA
jgi:hypothetical protein